LSTALQLCFALIASGFEFRRNIDIEEDLSKIKDKLQVRYVHYAAFTHAGLTNRYRTKSLCKSIFLLPSLSNILSVKIIKFLLHAGSKKFEF